MDSEKESAGASSGRGRVLIIDDSRVVRRILQMELEAKGFEVETAEDGKSGIAKAAASTFDLIVIDGLMPGLDGFDTCLELSKMRGESGRPLLVMHTNIYKDAPNRLKASTCGADEFVLKVLDGGPLVNKVVELLSGAGPRA